jgi:hypothetical protein
MQIKLGGADGTRIGQKRSIIHTSKAIGRFTIAWSESHSSPPILDRSLQKISVT